MTFLVGFNMPFSNKTGVLSASVDNYLGGRLLSQTAVTLQPCKPNAPGLKTAYSEFGPKSSWFCPNTTQNVTLLSNHLDSGKQYQQLVINLHKCKAAVWQDCDPDLLFFNFVEKATFSMFVPKKTILLKSRESLPVFEEFVRPFETRLDINSTASYQVWLQINHATFYDSFIANILKFTNDFKFLSFSESQTLLRSIGPDWSQTKFLTDPKLATSKPIFLAGNGVLINQIKVELDPFSPVHFRKTQAIWDLLALGGGFFITILWFAKQFLKVCKTNNEYHISQEYLQSQYQTRTRDVDLKIHEFKERDSADEIEEEVQAKFEAHKAAVQAKLVAKHKKQREAYARRMGIDLDQDNNNPDSISAMSAISDRQIEEQVAKKSLNTVIEEICARERFRVQVKQSCKRYFNFCDNEEDEMVNKIRAIGVRKLDHDMDINRFLKKVRNYDAQYHMLLSERQQYLLRFNARHAIGVNPDDYSSDSQASLFSVGPKEEDRNMVIRQSLMYRLNEDLDPRGERCGYKLLTQDLHFGVGRCMKESANASSLLKSSSFVDSSNMSQKQFEILMTPSSIQDSVHDDFVSRDLSSLEASKQLSVLEESSVLRTEKSKTVSGAVVSKSGSRLPSKQSQSDSQLDEIDLSGSIQSAQES